MKQIPLNQGYVALVDDEDYEELAKYTWHAVVGRRTVYAYRFGPRKEGRKHIPMHRSLLNAPADMDVDHIDGNGLNNTRANIRLATTSQNNGNRAKTVRKTYSRFKGVTWYKRENRWVAQIVTNNKRRYLGIFTNEEDAARAYDKAALEQWGEFAKLNFPRNEEAA